MAMEICKEWGFLYGSQACWGHSEEVTGRVVCTLKGILKTLYERATY